MQSSFLSMAPCFLPSAWRRTMSQFYELAEPKSKKQKALVSFQELWQGKKENIQLPPAGKADSGERPGIIKSMQSHHKSFISLLIFWEREMFLSKYSTFDLGFDHTYWRLQWKHLNPNIPESLTSAPHSALGKKRRLMGLSGIIRIRVWGRTIVAPFSGLTLYPCISCRQICAMLMDRLKWHFAENTLCTAVILL